MSFSASSSDIGNSSPQLSTKCLISIINRFVEIGDDLSALHHSTILYLSDKSNIKNSLIHFQCLLRCGKFKLILQTIDDPKSNPQLLLIYCKALMKSENHAEALRLLNKFLGDEWCRETKRMPDKKISFSLYLIRAQCYEEMDILKLAAKNYLLAFFLDPLSFHCLDKIDALSAFVSSSKGEIISKIIADVSLNIKVRTYVVNHINNKLAENLKLPPNYNILKTVLPSTNLAINLLYQHHFDDAKSILNALVTKDFTNILNIKLYIESLIFTKSELDLILLIMKIADFSPNHYITWYAVGSYNYLIGNYKKAESELLICQKLNKSFSRVYIGLGMLSRLLSNFTMTTYYFICGTNVSHRPEPWIFAAQNSLKHSDSIKALGFMKKALQIEPNNFLTLIGCASLFIRKSNYYAAKLFLEKSLKIFDSSNGYKYSNYRENAFFNLAMCELYLKNFETAKHILSNHIFSLHNNESYKIAMSICLIKTSDLKLEESLQEIQKYVSQISKYNFLSTFVHMDEIQL